MYSYHNYKKLVKPGKKANYIHTWICEDQTKFTWNISEVPYNDPKTYSWKYNTDHKAVFLL